MLPVSELVADARNARHHPPSQIVKLAKSIEQFGFLNPVVVAGRDIVAGHARVLAAEQLGLDKVPCIPADHLSPAQRRAFALADNRIAIESEWNELALRESLKELDSAGFEIEFTGFDLGEVASIIGKDYNYAPNLTPETDHSRVTSKDVQETAEELASDMTRRSAQDLVSVMCPHCGSEFGIRKDEL